ncbi:Chitinase A1 [Andreprevotia sp. IGB-42]|uniref:glycosyl hydrolase family 18 protein n=1 Tax=Andreprevotia sp. IGB-42 TaxID=2497473 RepID=UPI00157F4942|nr:glycosyl hydrolase family 18 protein [Andreprevotia sp. IGB-42]KAF0813895.1 Chitinase A1 [Andreprevotia sp. IGB-42]
MKRYLVDRAPAQLVPPDRPGRGLGSKLAGLALLLGLSWAGAWAADWQAASAYTKGDVVSYLGQDWQAQWWNKGETPTGASGAWLKVVAAGDQGWQAGRAYNGGTQVSHGGQLYKAKWWTQGEQPGKRDVWQWLGAEPKVIGYYISWGQYSTFGNFGPLKIKANLYTHINYAFAAVREDGTVYMPDEGEWYGESGWGDVANFVYLAELKKQYPHLKTLISIGGGGSGSKYFSNAGLTPESRQHFADSAVAFMRKHGFDGLDIDWEHPTFKVHPDNIWRAEDIDNYPLLFKTVRATLDAAGKQDGKTYLLTLASEANPANLVKYDWKTVADNVDWINVMAYQYAGPWGLESGHIAPLYADPVSGKPPKYNADGTIQTYLQKGVPASKLVMGFEYNGHIWNGCQPQNQGRYTQCTSIGKSTWDYPTEGALDYQDIKRNYVNKNGYTRYWSDAARMPWLFNAQTGSFIAYEDPQSITEKLKYLKQNKLGGAMVWEVTADRDDDLAPLLAGEILKK